MIRVILTAHLRLATAFRQVAESLSLPPNRLVAVDLAAGDSPESLHNALAKVIDTNQPTVLMTDIYGGTPWQVAVSLASQPVNQGQLAVVSGMNLAMILEACLGPDQESLGEAIKRIVNAAGDSIRVWPDQK